VEREGFMKGTLSRSASAAVKGTLCSRSASAAVSMAHVILARVSAVRGRAGGTAFGGGSSDCAVSCCVATLMPARTAQHAVVAEVVAHQH